MQIGRGTVLLSAAAFYFLTMLNSAIESLAMVLLVSIFTSMNSDGSLVSQGNAITDYFLRALDYLAIENQLRTLLPILIGLFAVGFTVRLLLFSFDGVLAALCREKLQVLVARKYLGSRWEDFRNVQVGSALGTISNESVLVSKYLSTALQTFFFFSSALVTFVLAIAANPRIAFYLGLVGIPALLIMIFVFAKQSIYSREVTHLRNIFSADVTDRLTGGVQVNLDRNLEYHLKKATRTQSRLSALDVRIGVCTALINSFNLLLPLFGLLAIFIYWKFFLNIEAMGSYLGAFAGVGVLGLRTASQLNGAVSSFGGLTRLMGSVPPVLNALSMPYRKELKPIPEPIRGLILKSVSYRYHPSQNPVLENFDLSAQIGHPILLQGRSGRGKTTLANILSGLQPPTSGHIEFMGVSGKKYLSSECFATVGYVPQDIHLFHDTIRGNLVCDRKVTDEDIWKVLEKIDAADFVRSLGGLDRVVSEGGKSLSGGQRRRLGIARALCSGCQILLLDESTAGLDTQNKDIILKTITELSKDLLVIFISHEKLELENFQLCQL